MNAMQLVEHLKQLKNLTTNQKTIVELSAIEAKNSRQKAIFNALLNAELAQLRADQARAKAKTVAKAAEKAAATVERKARNHEMFKSAGLLSLSKLVDTSTGKPAFDTGTLLGGLLSLAAALENGDAEKLASWKTRGDSILAATKPASA